MARFRRSSVTPVATTPSEGVPASATQTATTKLSPAPASPPGRKKTAWILGSGLAGLSAAAFLVRDAQVPGENFHILEQDDIAGGGLDGIKEPEDGFVIRGGREMENHFESLWDLFRSVPSLEIEGGSVLDEFYWPNKDDPNYSLQRATQNRGEDGHTDGKFTLSKKAQKELIKLFLATREEVENVRICASTSGSARTSSTRTSGSTGARCSPSRSGTPRSTGSTRRRAAEGGPRHPGRHLRAHAHAQRNHGDLPHLLGPPAGCQRRHDHAVAPGSSPSARRRPVSPSPHRRCAAAGR